MEIVGLKEMTTNQIYQEVQRGGRFVVYEYCFSLILVSFRRSSKIHFIRAGESSVAAGLGYTLISLLFGWWGIPFGIVFTFMCLFKNLGGGKDVTNQVTASLGLHQSLKETIRKGVQIGIKKGLVNYS